MNKRVEFQDLGYKDYKQAWGYQEELFQNVIDIKIKNRRENSNLLTPNYFLFVEHPDVYGLGKSGDMSNLLLSETQLKEKQQQADRAREALLSEIKEFEEMMSSGIE